jgi:hypothetical protein
MTSTRIGQLAALWLAAWVTMGHEAQAQTTGSPPAARPVAVEGTFGYAGFVDDATRDHDVFGIAARIAIGRRLSVGPEIVYMIGPQSDRDWFVLGSLWVDLGSAPETARVVPYVVVGGGYQRHSDRFASGRFASGEGSFTAGGGARVHVIDGVYVGGDVRLGWELHLRATAHAGVTWPRR